MTPEIVLDIGRQAMEVTALLVAPLLISALVVGLIVGMFQAATQINEMTLSFVPKLIVTGLVVTVAGPSLLQTMVSYTTRLFESIPELIG
ncbi:MAG: flagellar biosynthesis protein FliQ [Gammaproteobacteria bacterium]